MCHCIAIQCYFIIVLGDLTNAANALQTDVMHCSNYGKHS